MKRMFYYEELEALKQKWPKLQQGIYLYILYDPVDNDPRYIGQTNFPYYRMVQHLLTFGGTRLNADTKKGWLARLYFMKMIPRMEVVAIVEKSMAEKQELSLIGSYLCSGIDLLNVVRKRRIT